MIDKIEIFEGDKLIPFEIESFDLSSKVKYQLGEMYYLTEIKISGKPFSARIREAFNNITPFIKVKIIESYKDMKSEIIIDNLYIHDMYYSTSDDFFEFTLKQKLG